FIKERQLTEKLGWRTEDKQYGGWGYCRVVPRKPEPGQFAPPLIESNLSATVFAVEALKAAGALDAETAKAAAVFIRRCQNEDGGFHFIYDDPVRNKAGSPDPPGAKEARFHSYGSTTADGLRALSLCNLPEDKGNIERARAWLAKHFRADTHPGEYTRPLEPNREAVYYYYTASVARALRERKAEKAGGMDWAAALQKELGKRQRDDGSWANPVELVRENDPIVATAAAVSALANCR
ncbi:MAG TPA: prenyltransferase/squalene oxidase repeat-containing protein, partial [Gemmata sp.]|nr:prenyltransferase/squalene oxidase repeat-containing protein [Gemmata sp.]